MYNILEHKQAIAENIQKAFGDTSENIEKAKWQIGEIRVDSRGIAHECYEYTADGKPRLRRVKKNKGASTTSTEDKDKNANIRSNGLTSKQETEIEDNLRSKLDELFPKKLGRITKIKIEKKSGGLWNDGKDYIEAKIDSDSKQKSPNNPLFVRSVIRSKDGGKNWEVITSGLNHNFTKLQDERDDRKKEVDNFMKLVQKFSNKYTDESKITVTKTPKGNWDVSYNGSRLGIINADQLSEKTAKAKGWLEEENDKKEESEKIDIQDYFGKRPTIGGKSGNELKLIYDTAIKAFNNSLKNKDFSESNAEKFLKDTFKSFYFDDNSIENYVFYSLDKWKKAVKKYNDKNTIAKKEDDKKMDESDNFDLKIYNRDWKYKGNTISKKLVEDIFSNYDKKLQGKRKINSIKEIDDKETYIPDELNSLFKYPDNLTDKKEQKIYQNFNEAMKDHNIKDDEMVDVIRHTLPISIMSAVGRNSDLMSNIKLSKVGEVREDVKSNNIYSLMASGHYDLMEVSFDLKVKSKVVKVKTYVATDKTLSMRDVASFM